MELAYPPGNVEKYRERENAGDIVKAESLATPNAVVTKETKSKWKIYLIINIIGWPLNLLFSHGLIKIEGSHEDYVREACDVKKAGFEDRIHEFTNQQNISKEQILDLISESKLLCEGDPGEKKWNLINAVAFVAETGLTIGFGSITPQTDAGKLWTVLIALVMVPFFAFGMATLGSGIVQSSIRRTLPTFNLDSNLRHHLIHNIYSIEEAQV